MCRYKGFTDSIENEMDVFINRIQIIFLFIMPVTLQSQESKYGCHEKSFLIG